MTESKYTNFSTRFITPSQTYSILDVPIFNQFLSINLAYLVKLFYCYLPIPHYTSRHFSLVSLMRSYITRNNKYELNDDPWWMSTLIVNSFFSHTFSYLFSFHQTYFSANLVYNSYNFLLCYHLSSANLFNSKYLYFIRNIWISRFSSRFTTLNYNFDYPLIMKFFIIYIYDISQQIPNLG